MGEYETEYDLEETDAPEPEEPKVTDSEETESEESGSGETDPEEETGEEAGEESVETDEPEEGIEEEPAEEELEEEPETVSGNDIVIRGDAVIFPEEFDLASLEGEPVDTASIVQAVEQQTNVINVGFSAVSFLLGIISGIVLIQGFRLRRV